MLYHYCTLEKAVELILPKYQLLVNDISKTNDPRENKIFPIEFNYSKTIESLSDDFNINNEIITISDELRKGCKVLCFSVNNNNRLGYEISPMWAHYGSKHKGVCLEIDKDKFIAENICDTQNTIKINPDYLRQIDYSSRLNTIFLDYDEFKSKDLNIYIQQLRKEKMNELYFTKLNDWSYESEYRLLHISKNTENEYCSIRNSLTSIYLGVDFCMPFAEAIRKICPDIKIHRLLYTAGSMYLQPYN